MEIERVDKMRSYKSLMFHFISELATAIFFWNYWRVNASP